jgi:hypothetical protein
MSERLSRIAVGLATLLLGACSAGNPNEGASVNGGGGTGGAATDGGTTPDGGGAATDGSSTDGLSAVDAVTDAAPSAAFVCPPPPTTPGTCSAVADIRCPLPKLSQTGCMDAANPRQLAATVFPYEVNSPLWSDGALKTRGMKLPANQKIHVKNCLANAAECCIVDLNNFPQCLPARDDGKWVFPIGTVMVKNFMFPDSSDPSGMKFVETRLFMRLADGLDKDTGKVGPVWVGYGYRWNDQQTDATIVSDAVKDVRSTATFSVMAPGANGGAATKRDIVWYYPSRADCMQCHRGTDPIGGFVLGPETAQMNRVVAGQNQLDRLQAMGAFDAAIPQPYKPALIAPYMSQAGTPPANATVDQRARSYLHANCAFCHRPDGSFTQTDFRYDAPFKDMGLCNQMPAKGDLDVDGALLLAPQLPMKSVIWLRMVAPGPTDPTDSNSSTMRMPQIASYVVDTQATTLISDWITEIAACPAP